MSNNNNHPTQEQIRNARHAGFIDSVNHMPKDKRARLASSYGRQDQRRERNVSQFYASVQKGTQA